ncbi:response regulator transcription factor [Paenibacillus sp. 1P07SE]|uniref:response regulator transcription factor n=1 Tax=Paenibacillus sp. 1P07SE TaxID=3132209 RepID=UPI0039A485DB
MIDILLVDDEVYVTSSLAKTIPWAAVGIRHVYQAASAQEALALLEETPVDIVVTDIAMPEMDGLALLQVIGERWPHIKSILLSGHSDFQYARKAVQLQAFDYILKPLNDDDFVHILTGAINALKDEWEQAEKMHQLQYSRKSDLKVLRANLMMDLVLGRQLSPKTLQEKLQQYEIPLVPDKPTVLLLVQLGRQFSHLDYNSVSLMEFAIGNIAEESFAGSFQVWHGKAPHEYLILLVQPRSDAPPSVQYSTDGRTKRQKQLAEAAQSFRTNVSNYLKGDISIVVTEWFQFPDAVSAAYRAGLGTMFMIAHEEHHTIHYLEERDGRGAAHVKSLESLYKPPTLITLLESKRWEAVREKIGEVFVDLTKTGYSREHLYEVYLALTNAYLYVAHRQGHYVSQIDELGINFILDQTIVLSPERLRGWSDEVLRKLESELAQKEESAKSFIVKQVHEIVASNLSQDTTVKTIADRVFLHPVYLSKVFKAETGESLSDWIISFKMERALYLLKHTNKKIYEITSDLGYQNPQYFSKTFKKYYGSTPQEFRER